VAGTSIIPTVTQVFNVGLLLITRLDKSPPSCVMLTKITWANKFLNRRGNTKRINTRSTTRWRRGGRNYMDNSNDTWTNSNASSTWAYKHRVQTLLGAKL